MISMVYDELEKILDVENPAQHEAIICYIANTARSFGNIRLGELLEERFQLHNPACIGS